MKILLLIAGCIIMNTVFAQKINQSSVPDQVKKVFSRIYPNTKVNWEKEDGNYEANFQRAGKKMSTVMNDKGSIVETEAAIRPSDLPSRARNYVQATYDSPIKEASRITKTNGKVFYQVGIKEGQVLFDAGGHFQKMDSYNRE